jgi:hypothetical protein
MPSISAPFNQPYHYPDHYNRYPVNRFTNSYPWQGKIADNRNRWNHSKPRYTGQTPYSRYRFRPLNRPGLGDHPYPVPYYQRSRPGWGPYNAAMPPGWQPYMAMRSQGAPWPGMNRHGVDWYDGMGDGEGAWYKFAGQQEWPRVTQHLPDD